MKKLYIIILIYLVFPLLVSAENMVYINCPENIQKNSEFTCDVMVNTDYPVNAIDMQYKINNNVEFIEYSKDDFWQGESLENRVSIYSATEKDGNNYSVGTLKFRAKSNIDKISYTITYLEYSDKNYKSNIIIDNVNQNVNKSKHNCKPIIIIAMIIIVVILIVYIIRRKGSNHEKK